jgi:hypothetical protein
MATLNLFSMISSDHQEKARRLGLKRWGGVDERESLAEGLPLQGVQERTLK